MTSTPPPSPDSPLLGARLKLHRARLHYSELEASIKEYFASKPFFIDKVDDKPTGDLLFLLRMKKPVPVELAGIVGDVIHNARAALDHLAWKAVEADGGVPSRATAFPIAKDKAAFEVACSSALAGAGPRTLSLVRRLAPYDGGNQLLWRLHNLDIFDKHRLLIAVGAAYKHVVLSMTMPVPWQNEPVAFPPIALNPADRMFPLIDGSELFRVNAQARGAPGSENPQFTFEIAFGAGGIVEGDPLLPALEAIIAHVQRIVGLFQRFVFRIP